MKIKPICTVCLVLSTSSAIAAVPIDGFYAGGFGGYNYVSSNVNKTHLGLTRSAVTYNSPYDFGGRIGYQSEPLRYEAEVTYIHAEVSRFAINNYRVSKGSGYSNAVFGMANVYYDFPEMVPSVAPFVGAGLGYGFVEALLKNQQNGTQLSFNDEGSAFAWQVTAGFNYSFSECWGGSIAYRYISTDRVAALGKIYQANLATIGIVYRFDGNRYK